MKSCTCTVAHEPGYPLEFFSWLRKIYCYANFCCYANFLLFWTKIPGEVKVFQGWEQRHEKDALTVPPVEESQRHKHYFQFHCPDSLTIKKDTA